MSALGGFQFRSSRRSACVALTLLVVPLSAGLTSAQTLSVAQALPAAPTLPVRVLQVGGSVETLGQVWEQARPAQPVSQALRTGTGRAVLGLPDGGQLVLGSGSLMRVNSGPAGHTEWALLRQRQGATVHVGRTSVYPGAGSL